jgi:hypothetical protein
MVTDIFGCFDLSATTLSMSQMGSLNDENMRLTKNNELLVRSVGDAQARVNGMTNKGRHIHRRHLNPTDPFTIPT